MDHLPLFVGIACLGVTVLFVVAMVSTAKRERKRRDRLTRWAHQHGWTITPYPAVDWGRRLPGGNPRGVSLAVSAVVAGRPVSVAEYSYTETQTTTTSDGQGGTSTTQTTQTHSFTVVVVRLTRAYPGLTVEPRPPMSRLGQRLTGGGKATGHDGFDRRYRVRGGDPGTISRLIGPALIDEHLAGTVPSWSVYGPELLSYRPGVIDMPEHIPALVGPLLRVAQHLESRQ
ncbi:hypothetical protein [Plantactinospora sp. B24E8]|uniref:hypothetical protein n=1 Tax=Plantactinospora sp. B24E8 TaxID=3153567 RepID=UPI00325F48F1